MHYGITGPQCSISSQGTNDGVIFASVTEDLRSEAAKVAVVLAFLFYCAAVTIGFLSVKLLRECST